MGDATNPVVLRKVQIENARVLVVARSDPFGARHIVQLAREPVSYTHLTLPTKA